MLRAGAGDRDGGRSARSLQPGNALHHHARRPAASRGQRIHGQSAPQFRKEPCCSPAPASSCRKTPRWHPAMSLPPAFPEIELTKQVQSVGSFDAMWRSLRRAATWGRRPRPKASRSPTRSKVRRSVHGCCWDPRRSQVPSRPTLDDPRRPGGPRGFRHYCTAITAPLGEAVEPTSATTGTSPLAVEAGTVTLIWYRPA